MRAFRGTLLAVTLLVMAGAAQAQELKVGNTYRDSVQITKDSGGIILPLPEGEWKLVALEPSRYTSTDNNLAALSGAFVLLDLTQQKRLKSFITFYVIASDMFAGGWKVPPLCDAEDSLHLEKMVARRGKEIRCWGIKSYGTAVGPNAAQWLRDTDAWIVQNTAHKPASVIGVTYFRASGPKLLNVAYLFNPATVGQAASGWTSSQVEADPKKKKYIENLKAFGVGLERRVETGFAGKQP